MVKDESEVSSTSGILNSGFLENRQEKAKVCFGSGLERKTLEADTKGMVSKHARTHIRENLPVGPATYDTLPLESAMYRVLNKPTSKLGTVLGGRREERKGAFKVAMFTPAPGTYSIPTTFPDVFKQMCAPFNTNEKREKLGTSNVPGVGTYNVSLYKHRTAGFAHSFGGKKCLLPAVKIKCGPFNFDTCKRCEKYPDGDYWYLDTVDTDDTTKIKKLKQFQGQSESEGIFLCRGCYNIEKKENRIFSKTQMRNFKKIRDCSKIHFHDGCKAKLFLVSPREIAKVKEREAYLQLYFN